MMGRWVVASRLRSPEPVPGHVRSLPPLFSGDACCPSLWPPKPTSSSQEDPWVLPACAQRLEALRTVSGGRPGLCLVCPSAGDHCPAPTGV